MNDISNINLPVQISLSIKQNVFNFGLTGAANIKGHIRLSEQGNTDQPEATLSQYSQKRKTRKKVL